MKYHNCVCGNFLVRKLSLSYKEWNLQGTFYSNSLARRGRGDVRKSVSFTVLSFNLINCHARIMIQGSKSRALFRRIKQGNG